MNTEGQLLLDHFCREFFLIYYYEKIIFSLDFEYFCLFEYSILFELF